MATKTRPWVLLLYSRGRSADCKSFVGPLYFPGNATTPAANPNSWTKLANVLYIDQPVGTGYSDGWDQATINAQVTQEFEAWLAAFYGLFPSLQAKNTYIIGESYAGIYVSQGDTKAL